MIYLTQIPAHDVHFKFEYEWIWMNDMFYYLKLKETFISDNISTCGKSANG